MRLFFISLCIAVITLLPQMTELFDFSLHGVDRWLIIPQAGLGYMLVFFHELGHTMAFWFFGYPAIPTFDFTYGGGMTYAIDRVWLLQGLVWLCMAGGIFYLTRRDEFLFDSERRPLLALALGLAGAQVFLALTDYHHSLTAFMGYGGEVIIAFFCLTRAALGLTKYGVVERYLNMVFGLFVLGNNMLLLGGLIGSDIARDAYAQQKGQELAGDFDQIAINLNISLQSVAKLSFGFMGLMLIGAVTFIWWWKNNEDVPDDRGPLRRPPV